VAWKISFHRVENVGQRNGILIDITFPVCGMANKFQCPGIDIFWAILRFDVVFCAVYNSLLFSQK
jgi:hypothetical protein